MVKMSSPDAYGLPIFCYRLDGVGKRELVFVKLSEDFWQMSACLHGDLGCMTELPGHELSLL